MATGYRKSNNRKLSTLYRLEFYKKQKYWKLTNDKLNKTQAKSSRSSLTTSLQCSNNLDKTYDVLPTSDEGNKSSVNTGFINEMLKDEKPLSNLPPPTARQTYAILKPATQSSHEATRWNQSLFEIKDQRISDHVGFSQTLTKSARNNQDNRHNQVWQTSDLGTLTKYPSQYSPHTHSSQNTSICSSSSRTGNKTNPEKLQDPNNCTGHNQVISASLYDKPYIWNRPLPCSLNLLQQDTSIKQAFSVSTSTHQTNYAKSILPQAPPADTLKQLLCPNKWQSSVVDVENIPEIQNLSISEKNPQIWIDQKHNLLTNLLDSKRNIMTGSQTICEQSTDRLNHIQQIYPQDYVIEKVQHKIHSHKKMHSDARQCSHKTAIKSPINDNSESLKPLQDLCEESRTNPEVLPTLQNMQIFFNNPDEVANEPYIWVNQAWLKQQQLILNNEKKWGMPDENLNGLSIEENATRNHEEAVSGDRYSYGCEPQYAVENYYEMSEHIKLNTKDMLDVLKDTPQHIREETEKCLQKFISLFKQNDDSITEGEFNCDQNQDASVEFIRKAHEVPHSSEKDPDETKDFDFSMIDKSITANLSTRNLGMMLKRSAKLLSVLLQEERLRNEMRKPLDVNLIEYPTRDTDPFHEDYILDGSHLPHDTTHLEVSEISCKSEGIIKINMGRPCRL